MDKVAGPYLHTQTGILGDKRSTMLENELQYKVGIVRVGLNVRRLKQKYSISLGQSYSCILRSVSRLPASAVS